jgi:hypothetical protein
MANVQLNPVFTGFSRKIDNLVFYTKNGKTFVRRKPIFTKPMTENQIGVRNAFKTLADIWRGMNGIFRTAWEISSENSGLSGYNAFIGANVNNQRGGKPLELFKSLGETAVSAMTAVKVPDAGAIDITFTLPGGTTGKSVTFFAQKIENGIGAGGLARYDGGINTISPFRIAGIDVTAEYFVYAVVTDGAYDEAQTCSAAMVVRG